MTKFEEYLQTKHAEVYTGLDDDMPDAYEAWLTDLEVDDWIKYGTGYGELTVEEFIDETHKFEEPEVSAKNYL